MPKKKYVCKIKNTLTKEQRQELSDRLKVLIGKYHAAAILSEKMKRDESAVYYYGTVEGLSNAYKLVNQIVDDYLIDEEIQ